MDLEISQKKIHENEELVSMRVWEDSLNKTKQKKK